MDLRNCPGCGKLYAYDGIHKLCPVCREEEEGDFQKVKDYLWEHPKATIDKVHQETEVPREKIIKFVKEDRLIADGIDVDLELSCDRCGRPITHGRYCAKCQQELIKGFSTATKANNEKNRKKPHEEMHIKDRLNKRKKK